MKIQFFTNNYFTGRQNIVAEFDVAGMPTEDQCNAIEDYIYEARERDELVDSEVILDALISSGVKIEANPVVKSFYI